ncbi:MAG TPA: NAD(P)-dependent oxidoreductase [Stellaceae bacterium]|nr:NAD(P)-dependent oxidoreductase [Stellaceae bacterium]
MDKIVGMIGLGIMGSAIARNLAERGWTVLGFDTDGTRNADLAKDGIVIARGAAEIAARAPIILTSLPSPYAAKAVAEEISSSQTPARIVCELSTLTLEDKQEFHHILTKGGHKALDCPLSGTGAQAIERDLVIYASGDAAAVKTCLPVFADFGRKTAELGSYGNGTKMKYIANHLVAINNVASAEAMWLASKAGLDLEQVFDVVSAGAGNSRVFELRAPMMVEENYKPATMKVAIWKKDMAIIGAFAESLGAPTPIFDLTQGVYTDAMRMGLADDDTASVYEVLKTYKRP